MDTKSQIDWEITAENFSPLPPPPNLHSIYFGKSRKHVFKYRTIYKVLIIQNIKITFTFYDKLRIHFLFGLKNSWPQTKYFCLSNLSYPTLQSWKVWLLFFISIANYVFNFYLSI
jgi:hypothetical protein